ncbi:crossover junction endodeoxyribonuclease RuvC [Candidatus Woesebacteria bacterium RIFCSPHIGHO2_01_FULL_44_21]|uniref:Crossover junction endodeoxyribonuclease RuvC n=1 Tax=Candidatus Woesebacteria bacterium RIFCSPHIGHO2_01_FULL_44_21 TaxID=1802503 RepID=A0A1F7YZS0_9BACT|nr:MAG: crossover junction endodeoxyribonuclease RuvC [Candidatus Woesebacteria bacterium RIFCSPHIGHO2_01_FULL_44_21]OGM71134.1 MAG: crossover junction endodeoxyribonuclease RuvC [Candidatus Woesebacteria bacterium RIFCSPLOWO2_01_FULL_44_24b]
MIVLGIDPGTATTGYSLLEANGRGLIPLEFDLIETKKSFTHAERLSMIYDHVREIIRSGEPDVMAIEKVFFAANAKTAIAVGQAQGVMFLAAADFKLPIVEYAPGTIKKVVSGNGRSDKKQMQQALRSIFGASIRSQAKKKTHFDNAADALAVAYCHVKMTYHAP